MKTITIKTVLRLMDALDEYIQSLRPPNSNGMASKSSLIKTGIVDNTTDASYFIRVYSIDELKEHALLFLIVHKYPDLRVIKGSKSSILLMGKNDKERTKELKRFIHKYTTFKPSS